MAFVNLVARSKSSDAALRYELPTLVAIWNIASIPPRNIFAYPGDQFMGQNMSVASLTKDELAWIEQVGNHQLGEACVAYGRAINLLNFEEMAGLLSDDVTYESQSAFEKLEGRERVEGHLRGKLQAIKKSGRKVLAELGMWQGGPWDGPCVLIYQAMSDADTTWAEEPIVAMTPSAGDEGLLTELLNITVVPPPSSAKRSGVFPAAKTKPAAKKSVRKSDDFSELTLCVFYLDGTSEVDCLMRKIVSDTAADFPGLSILEYEFVKEGPGDLLAKFQFTGFPSVGLLFDGKVVARQQGVISRDRLKKLIQGAVA